jgi:hypothetical protein
MSKEGTTMRLRRLITVLMLATLVDAPAYAATDLTATCSAIKARAVGKNAYDELKCQAMAARAVDPSCIAKAEEKLALAFTRAEQRGGCAGVGNAPALQSRVDGFVAGTVAALPAMVIATTTTTTIPPPRRCPGGGAGFPPHCWYAGVVGQSCDQVCTGVGRAYDPTTATLAASDVGCFQVFAALTRLPLDQIDILFTGRSEDCAASGLGGLGCFSRMDSGGGVAGFGRCAAPLTAGDASAPEYARFCACQ